MKVEYTINIGRRSWLILSGTLIHLATSFNDRQIFLKRFQKLFQCFN